MQAEQLYYSPEEYLELEAASVDRHEYIDGQIILMPGGLPNHNRLTHKLAFLLEAILEGDAGYDIFVVDQRLWIPQRRIYTYPDMMVAANPLIFQEGRRDTITNPVAIAEVLSKSTQEYDRGEKFAAYRTLPTLQEYLLVDPSQICVEQYIKTAANEWRYLIHDGATEAFSLASVPCSIALSRLYQKVDFNAEA
ncbi:MAG: Uma2 family endonuclease [Oculatellaceae cyanobacterium Prado106]|jgi:Uma2 family endonuclease|nr:Uma2 family endonuclease [Oculatellaceae cyanobacterium Prado106]